MKVKVNLSNQTLEYMDTQPYIQGTDTRNKLNVYIEHSSIPQTEGAFNIMIAYALQNGRTTIKMANTGATQETIDDVVYDVFYFTAPSVLTSVAGNFVATIILKVNSNTYKVNVFNTVLNSVEFEAFEDALDDVSSEFIETIEGMSEDITYLQGQVVGVLHNTDIVDNDDSNDPTKVLSARMGKVLAERIGATTSGLVSATYNESTGVLTLNYENDDTYEMKIGLSPTDKSNMADDVENTILADLFETFSTVKSYSTGNFVNYENNIYEFVSDKESGAWDSTKVVVANLNDYMEEVNTSLANMTETIEGLGNLQPSGTDTSTNILAFNEDKGIYIGTDTGHWYYWNGTQYADGGVYQTAVNYDLLENILKSIDKTIGKVLSPLFELYASLENKSWDWDNQTYIDNPNRLCNTTHLIANSDIQLIANSGYSFMVLYFVDGVYSTNSGAWETSKKINYGQEISLIIKKDNNTAISINEGYNIYAKDYKVNGFGCSITNTRNLLTDANNAEINKIYTIIDSGVVSNLPSGTNGQGKLITFNHHSNTYTGAIQFYITNDTRVSYYYRLYWLSWGNWKKIIIEDDINSIIGNVTHTITTGHYINASGDVVENSSFSYIDYNVSKLGGCKIKSGVYIGGWCNGGFYDKNNKLISRIRPNTDLGSASYITYDLIVPVEAVSYKISSQTSNNDKATFDFIVLTNSISDNAKEIFDTFSDIAMFEKFGVVGDSFASGEIYVNDVPNDYYNLSWGQIIARKCGNTCINFSKGGLTTRTWLTDSKGLPLVLASPQQNLYILALGLNDAPSGSSYLGTISDIHDEDYTLNADTFYGNYGRIVEQIKAYAPNCKIMISTMAFDTYNYATYNTAIVEIAEHYNIPLIDQRQDEFFQSAYYNKYMVHSHPVASVYSGMANALIRLINKCIMDNFNYFIDYIG